MCGIGLEMSCTPSAYTLGVPQPVLYILNMYYTPSAYTAHNQSVLHIRYTGDLVGKHNKLYCRSYQDLGPTALNLDDCVFGNVTRKQSVSKQ